MINFSTPLRACASLLLPLTLLILAWHSCVIFFHIPNYLLPLPAQVLARFLDQYSLLLTHSLPTLIEISLGFTLGICFGCLAGLMLAFCRPLTHWFLPLLIISQAIPLFAIAPLIVIWFGYGLLSKIIITILMIFFPITSAFYDGLRRTEAAWLTLAQTMNAQPWRSFWFIRIPAALPALASGIRIAAVIAPIGAIVGEWVGSSRGLGYLMLNANARLAIDQLFAALIIIILFALLLYFTVDWLLRKLIWWQT